EIQQEEEEQRHAKTQAIQKKSAPGDIHPRFVGRVGSVIAELVRESKPEAVALDPAMNLELDLGFDSLARVELLGLAEARLGTHIEEQQVARVFTLGELIDAFETASQSETVVGRSLKEIIDGARIEDFSQHHIFRPRPILNPLWLIAMRTVYLLSRVVFRL